MDVQDAPAGLDGRARLAGKLVRRPRNRRMLVRRPVAVQRDL
jgi:hypothetical protein